MRVRQWVGFSTLAASVLYLVSAAAAPREAGAQDQGQVREFTVSGNGFTFSPAALAVNKNDLVKITFTAQDMPHSFTIDDYRIVKRAGTGQTVTFEFRADRAGSFTFYCNLTQDPKCKDMKGTLAVR
ncbi:MAG TPA: cupredoxin domain-containing protein [Vicinamibacterales bacterium]|nr:cupredoxin domain-containing protein [Vicinamibacterales bacterium]